MTQTLHHVLVATDFTAASAAAIEYASALARSLAARLHIVHVLEEPLVTSRPYDWSASETRARREQRYRAAFDRLSQEAAAIDDVVTVSVEVRGGQVTQSIAQAAIDYGADLIVLGTRGQTGLRHLLAGDTAERLKRLSKRPILTVPEPGSTAVTPAAPGRRLAA